MLLAIDFVPKPKISKQHYIQLSWSTTIFWVERNLPVAAPIKLQVKIKSNRDAESDIRGRCELKNQLRTPDPVGSFSLCPCANA